jgi:uncharacterized RDD family membrane protein YckC
MTDLDNLLSAPLAPVDDAGFSTRVMHQVAQEQTVAHKRREIVEWSVLVAAACLFLLAVPLPVLNGVIEYITLNLSSSLPIGVAVGVIVLTTTYLRSTEQI